MFTLLFMQGGWFCMSLLTLNLIALLVAIWKAPQLVKILGILPWGYTLLIQFIGLMQSFDSIQAAGGIAEDAVPQSVLFGALKVILIPLTYAAFIYTISIIANIVATIRKK